MEPAEPLANPGALPEDLSQFFGRVHEVRNAKRLFSRTRLVTLTGVGGVGKTRIAIQLGRELRSSFPDGVCFVPLADLRDPALLGQTIAAALGMRDTARQGPDEALTRYLSTQHKLLVLDNCEHLLAAAAQLCAKLLASCRELSILATSREPIGVDGENTSVVLPLAVPDPSVSLAGLTQYDAVTMFVDRATAAVPSFKLTSANYRAVAALCHTLEGLPLALELAAVRLRALPVEELVARISDRHDLLEGSRGAPERQRDLRALMSWSYDLCTPEEQRLWMRLAVFSGGIELAAAEDICSDERLPRGAVLRPLTSLVEKSILMREDHGGRARYRLLEIVRQFGLQKLREHGGTGQWRRRHRDWYLHLVDRTVTDWSAASQTEQLDRMRADHANLRAALEFCVEEPGEVLDGLRMASSLYSYWLMRGLLSEGQLWIDRMLAIATEPGPARSRGLFVGASLATLRGDLAAGSRMLAEASEIAQRLGDQESLAYVVQGRGLVALYADEIEAAFALFQESLRLFEHVGDHTGAAFTTFLYGVAAMLRGDSVHVALAHARCRELTEAKGEGWIWSSSLWVTAVDAWRQGEPDRAAELLRSALRLKRPLDDHLGIVECIEALAWVDATNRNRERSATLLGAAERIWRGMGMTASTLPGFDRFHSESKRVARAIGERPFEAAYRAGQQMTFGEAVDCALGEPTPYRPLADHVDARARLTRRELEVAGLIAQGRNNREIAEGLVLSRRTVEAHVQHLLAKLGFTSRRQIASWVAERQAGGEHGR